MYLCNFKSKGNMRLKADNHNNTNCKDKMNTPNNPRLDNQEKKNVYVETYGCQMNFADSEIFGSILLKEGYTMVDQVEQSDYVLINTCAIRDNAEQRIRKRLRELRALQRQRPWMHVGILGCMAERLKTQLLEEEENVSFVVGPDAYRKLPSIMKQVRGGVKAAATELSDKETYDDIDPVRLNGNGISAYISIMRGCQNYCAYCVVPYTRGLERSRNPKTIVEEARFLCNEGYKEITLLGQNVNSYRWEQEGSVVGFPQLLAMVAEVSPRLRVRFATSHPKDLSDELLHTMARYDNICKSIHLPVQSGSERILKLMNRKYTPQWYLNRIEAIRTILPGCSISTDVIAGFCTETEEDHQATLEMFRTVRYDSAFMFKFSMRPDTFAARHLTDDVPEEVKTRRLEEIIALQNQLSLENNQQCVGNVYEVLVEGASRRSKEQLFGRTSQNKVVVFDRGNHQPGEYLKVMVKECSSATLKGVVVTEE